MKTAQNKCLLVDDDQDDQEFFQLAINEIARDLECDFYSNPVDAISALSKGITKPDIIFLDLNMPLMTGIQCMIELKKIDLVTRTPIIIYSTSSDPRFYSEALMNGAKDYVIKPNKISDLIKLLKTVLHKELNLDLR